MSRRIIYIIAALTLLLSACASRDDAGLENGETKEEKSKETVEEDLTELAIEKEEIEEVVQKEPLYKLDENWAFRPIGNANAKVVLLTIDDAPDKYALEMAKQLKALDVPAIFFVNGHFITSKEDEQILKEIDELGFAIGNHTQTHANLRNISEEEQRNEILSVSDIVEDVLGERPKFFRAPYGVNTDYSKALVKEEGMLLMNWSYGYDWEKDYTNADALTDIMVNTELLRDGVNLLMHDREWTAHALPGIVEGLRAKGYDFIDPADIKGVAE